MIAQVQDITKIIGKLNNVIYGTKYSSYEKSTFHVKNEANLTYMPRMSNSY